MNTVARLPVFDLAPKAFQALYNLSNTVKKGVLGARLVDLVWLRVSQVNGCAFCMDMHWQDLVKQGASARELNTVAGWRESPFFTPKERAALAWAERVAVIPQGEISDAHYAEAREQLSEAEVAELGFAVATITAWNLLNVSSCNPVPA